VMREATAGDTAAASRDCSTPVPSSVDSRPSLSHITHATISHTTHAMRSPRHPSAFVPHKRLYNKQPSSLPSICWAHANTMPIQCNPSAVVRAEMAVQERAQRQGTFCCKHATNKHTFCPCRTQRQCKPPNPILARLCLHGTVALALPDKSRLNNPHSPFNNTFY
jgi:hypothetical protein